MALQRVLFVDDSPDMQLLIKATLGKKYEVVTVCSAADAKVELQRGVFNLIILDIELPGQDGFKLCAELRTNEMMQSIPIVFLSGRIDPSDKVLGFSVGADDYICKPFELMEFSARIDSKLRKTTEMAQREENYLRGLFRIHSATQKISLIEQSGERDLRLTTNEFKLLLFFIRHEEHVLTRATILDNVWGYNVNVTDRTVDSHVYTLRKKLGSAAHFIHAIPRVGYSFSQNPVGSKSSAA